MATSNRGPIKVGSGYIEINTDLSKESIAKFRADIAKQMEKAGAEAVSEHTAAAAKGMDTLPKAAATAAKKAKQAVEAEAKDSAETIAAIERDLTKQFGVEATKRFKEARQLEERKQALAAETSAVTQAALRATTAQETAAATARSRATQAEEKERLASLRRVAAEALKNAQAEARQRQQALEQEARTDREIETTRLRLERETQAAIRETARVRQQAQREALRADLVQTQSVRDNLRTQLTDMRSTLREMESAHTSTLTTFRKAWGQAAQRVEHFGTTAAETGTLITHNVIAPLGLAAGAATTFGVKSADAMIQAQTGLRGMGVELKDVNSLLEEMTKYGIQTPYSVTDMLTYGTRYARANAAHNDKFSSSDPLAHAEGSQEVAKRSADMVKMIGDSAAYGGIMDPTMVSQGMYALEVIQDMGRTPLRNLKQLERATGIPSQQIAKLMGFRDRAYTPAELEAQKKMDKENHVERELPTTYEASAQMMAFMADAKNTGGISGETLIQKLLAHWQDPSLKIMGSAQRMGGATISGRIEQMKENAQFQLGQLFYSKGADGSYEYSGLGQSIMGKKVQDENGTHFEGGLLNDWKDIGKNSFPALKELLKATLDTLTRFTGWVKKITQYLEDHPGLTDMIMQAAKFAALMAPVLLGLGVLSKILGKGMKLANAAATPVVAAGRGVRGATRVARQARAGVASRRAGDGFLQGYRDRRVQLSGGTGGDQDRLRGQMRDVEAQIRQADERAAELRRTLQSVNGTQLRQIIGELSGATGSVENAARQAHTEVHQIQTQGIEPLNRSNLTALQQEITDTRQKAEALVNKIKDAQGEVSQLDGKKLVALKLQIDGAHGTATDLKNKIDDTSHAMVVLDGKNLNSLRGEFNQVHDSADKLYDKIGQGTGATSVAGRVGLLNGRSLSGLKAEFENIHDAANRAYDMVGQGTGATSLAGRVGLLNGRTLGGLKNEFDSIHNAADNAYGKVGQGTGEGSLAGRIGLLNGRSLSDITDRVQKLGNALDTASNKAHDLDTSIDNVTKKAPGGHNTDTPKKPTRKSTGGILPGYSPGVDSIPAILSPGEAVLRPEVTAALGAPLINHWNATARKGQLSRFAEGGIAGRFGVPLIREALDLQNIFPFGQVALKTMSYDATSDDVGGDAQTGMLGAGSTASKWVGSGIADRFKGMYDFMTDDSFKLMKRFPSLIGQAAGIAGGTLSPILGDYLWDDVWKGNGNIVERGKKFMGDTFSMKTLTGAGSNLFGGLWESVKSLAGGAKDLVLHPIDSVKEAFGGIWEIVDGEINQVVDMVTTVKDIYDAPGDYAGSVLGDVLSTAKDAMPNLEGLFDFSKGDKVNVAKPTVDPYLALGDEVPTGTGVTRWTDTVHRVLAELGLSQDYLNLVLHRIEVESGGNEKAINLWDSNAMAGHPSQGLMQTIPSTFFSYAGPYTMLGMNNGLASIYAGLNYAVHRYGSSWPQALSGTAGYWMGTRSAAPGLALAGENGPELINFRGGERVYNNRETKDLFSQGNTYEIHIHEAKSEDTTQATIRAFKYMENMYGI